MPITPTLIPNLNANFVANTLAGVNDPTLATAIATAIGSWANTPSNISLIGATSGVAGSGAVSGKLTLAPNPSFYETAFASTGLVGLIKTPLCVSLSNAVSTTFSSAGYVGSSSGVGIGTDITKVVFANGTSLVSILNSTFASHSIVGVNSPVLANAISIGVVAHLLTCVGNGAVAGSPSIIPSIGTSNSNVVI